MTDTSSLPPASASEHATEIAAGERFEFGKNWRTFLSCLNDDRIAIAEKSVQQLLELPRLDGLRFLDAGSGSGLFSLCARRLGATVVSFDFDPAAVACAEELKRRYFPGDDRWMISTGSVLDQAFLESLGQFDVVYSWGVLHHTGAMWTAIDNVVARVAPAGRLAISIYNDQGGGSRRWRIIKRLYNRRKWLRWPLLVSVGGYLELRAAAGRLKRLENPLPFKAWAEYKKSRGMSAWHDIIDWIGGYPFEVATPEAIFDFVRTRGFELCRLKTVGGGVACNEFAFRRTPSPTT